VIADMIEGVVVVNRLVAPEADQVRTGLWAMAEMADLLTGDVPLDHAPRVA
jgi:hypothetical protein